MRAIDLFCGCGGMSLGLQNAGIKVIAGYDNWQPAIDIYSKNFQHPVFKKDLYDADTVDLLKKDKPDLIFGGPPCQDFSIAGSRKIGARGNLTIRYAEIISEIKPEWFVMENVYNIQKMPVLPVAKKIFKDAGYGLSVRVLDASLCGAPQKRKRFVMIGHLSDEDGFMDDILDHNLANKPMTLYDYLGDTLGTEYYYMHPRSYNRRAVFSIHEPSATIRGVNRPIPKNYKKHPADKADIKDGVRSLSSKERRLIQTFPENFIFDGNKTAVEQAIGNAVPVKLAEYVANCINEYIEKQEDKK
jgi:DNA (cytosine-5)-methyltransferase 1